MSSCSTARDAGEQSRVGILVIILDQQTGPLRRHKRPYAYVVFVLPPCTNTPFHFFNYLQFTNRTGAPFSNAETA